MSRMHGSATVLLLGGLLCAAAIAPHAAQQQGSGEAPRDPAQQAAPARQGGPPPAGQGDAAPQQQPTFRGGIDFIRVDAYVSDGGGKPISDLTQAEFEILEDGKPQKIEQFRIIKVDGNEAPGEPVSVIRTEDDERREAQRDDVRVFAIFLDDYHTRDNNAIAMRATLEKFIRTEIRPTDMLAVMYPLTPVIDVFFTRDHEKIISAVRQFEGRKYDYRPRNQLEVNYERAPTDVVEKIRNEVVTTALEGLALRLGAMRDGRKSVIFVSEGFTVLLPPQMRRQNAQGGDPRLTVASDERVEMNEEAKNQMELDSRLRDVYKAANRNNTAFYSLDPRGLATGEYQIGDGGGVGSPGPQTDQRSLRVTQDTLRSLSEETDGRAIVNRNTLAEGLAQMVRDASFYYLIGYTTLAPADGKYHEIKVRVNRRGANVRARRGYWAITPAETKQLERIRSRTPTPAGVQQALASIAAPIEAARFVRTWIGTERGENGKTRVTMTWEPLPAQQGLRREQAGQVTVLAADSQGALVFRGRSPDGAASAPPAPAAASATPAARTASTPMRLSFEAPPGKLDLRISIEAAGGGTLDTDNRTIDVPDLTAPQAALSTPRVFRSRTARDFQTIVKDAAAVPVAAREFSRTERLLIRFDAYGAGSEKPVASAVLLGRDGKKISDVPVAAATAGGTHQIDLALNSMATGEYVVEITVKDTAGATATQMVPLRVGA